MQKRFFGSLALIAAAWSAGGCASDNAPVAEEKPDWYYELHEEMQRREAHRRAVRENIDRNWNYNASVVAERLLERAHDGELYRIDRRDGALSIVLNGLFFGIDTHAEFEVLVGDSVTRFAAPRHGHYNFESSEALEFYSWYPLNIDQSDIPGGDGLIPCVVSCYRYSGDAEGGEAIYDRLMFSIALPIERELLE
ncbi:MAG: hypothetical protein ACIAQF_10925 [Phycisphaerales bacterium JB065]